MELPIRRLRTASAWPRRARFAREDRTGRHTPSLRWEVVGWYTERVATLCAQVTVMVDNSLIWGTQAQSRCGSPRRWRNRPSGAEQRACCNLISRIPWHMLTWLLLFLGVASCSTTETIPCEGTPNDCECNRDDECTVSTCFHRPRMDSTDCNPDCECLEGYPINTEAYNRLSREYPASCGDVNCGPCPGDCDIGSPLEVTPKCRAGRCVGEMNGD